MSKASVRRPPSGAVGRAIQAAVREGLAAAAGHWHEAMMPGHFQTSAPAKYLYAPRSKKYMIRKARKVRHQRPLEYSGQSKDQAIHDYAITSGTIVDRPTSIVVMRMPSYFVQHPGGGTTFIDKPAELTRATPAEQEELAGVVARVAGERLGTGAIRPVAESA